MRTINDEFKKLEKKFFVRIRKVRLTRSTVIYDVFDMYLKQHHTTVIPIECIRKKGDAIDYILDIVEPLCGVVEYDRKFSVYGKNMENWEDNYDLDNFM